MQYAVRGLWQVSCDRFYYLATPGRNRPLVFHLLLIERIDEILGKITMVNIMLIGVLILTSVESHAYTEFQRVQPVSSPAVNHYSYSISSGVVLYYPPSGNFTPTPPRWAHNT